MVYKETRKVQPIRRRPPTRFQPRLEILEDRLAPATIVVNTAADTVDADPNVTSLREAINQSNASVGDRDVISFNIPGAGVHTISPKPALPMISDPVVIDGY